MAAPGVTVTVRDAAPPTTSPTEIDTLFIAHFAEKGGTTPILVESIDEFVTAFGGRVSYSLAYDYLDAVFQEGVSKAYFTRVLGPDPVYATATLETGSSTESLVIDAKSYGDWANGIQVVAAGAGPYTLTVKDADGNTLETSPPLTDQQDAVDWSASSAYVNITLGAGTGIPAAATATLASGTDDHGNATDSQWETVIGLFTKDLGPGQIAMPGRTTTSSHAALLTHAVANNRIALLDLADSSSASTLAAAAANDRAASGAEHGATFAAWALIPGIVDTGGVQRTVPYSAIAAGIMARNDKAGIDPNVPSAGIVNGVAQYAIGLTHTYSDADRDTLNAAGVNVAISKNGAIVTYGYRTLADPDADIEHAPLSNARLEMLITAEGEAILESFVFAQIDGQGFTLSDVNAELRAMLDLHYKAGALYGATAADAYQVITDAPVNTPATAAAFELNAQLLSRYSKYGEHVNLFLTRKSITQSL